MIISASRRTDIPAFYAEWFMNRIRAGCCTVPNPYNRKQVTRVSLTPENVDAIVFWTRHPRPLLPHLRELDARGYRYYFQYTLLDNPRIFEPQNPAFTTALDTFRALADHVGPERVIWRYDPIVLSSVTGPDFHTITYAHIAAALDGYTQRSVISFVDDYRKIGPRMAALAQQGIVFTTYDGTPDAGIDAMLRAMVDAATAHGMTLQSCAESRDIARCGIQPGKCIDDNLLRRVFGLDVSRRKDPSQREHCGCVVSRDIGSYDTCLFGCQYCYATNSFSRAKLNHRQHNPQSPSLVGWYEREEQSTQDQQQLSLWE